MGAARASGAAGAQRAVALRAAVVHGLGQDPVDLLAQLDDVGGRDPALVPRRRCEHVFVQRTPRVGNVGIGERKSVDVWYFSGSEVVTDVRTLWRPTMKATLRLQGLTKEDQLVSMVRYSPLRAHILKGAYSNGCPAI